MARIKVHVSPRFGKRGRNLEEVVALRDGDQDGYLSPRWIEWLMGFPVGWCPIPWKLSGPRSFPWLRKGSADG